MAALSKHSREEYYADDNIRDSVDHNFQLAIETCCDIGAVMLGILEKAQPDERKGIFMTLEQAGLLSEDLASFLIEAVGLRNILVHRYLTIDPEKMYSHLQESVAAFERFEAFVLAWLEDQEAA